MRRFFIDSVNNNSATITGEDHMHLAQVLRAKRGDTVLLCTPDGYEYTCEISAIERMQTHLHVLDKHLNQTEPSAEVTLFMSLLKGDKMDLVVQKVTELGVSQIYPMVTRFVQTKPENVKLERLNKIAAEAAKQCGRGRIPTVQNVISFQKMLSMLGQFDSVVFPYENATDTDIKTFLQKGIGKRIAIIIGSEGGFADEEAQSLTHSGVTPLSLGKRILRAETACIVVSGIVMCEAEQLR